jgi:hypothetical protein
LQTSFFVAKILAKTWARIKSLAAAWMMVPLEEVEIGEIPSLTVIGNQVIPQATKAKSCLIRIEERAV